MEINGKEFQVNTDLKMKTEKFIAFCIKNPDHPKVMTYTELIMRDLLIPSPTSKEFGEFRKSDIENALVEYGRLMKESDKDFKKKLST